MGTVKTDEQFEFCVRVHVSGDDSRATVFIAFRRHEDLVSVAIQHWQPPRNPESRKATAERKPDSQKPAGADKPDSQKAVDERQPEKFVDLILRSFGPQTQGHVLNAPDLAEIMATPKNQRNRMVARHFQQWLQDAALKVAAERNVKLGKVSANFAPLLEPIALESFNVAARVGSFLADDRGEPLDADSTENKPDTGD